MSAKFDRLVRYAPLAILIGLIVGGIILMAFAALTPEYSDAAQVENLRIAQEPGTSEGRDQWYRDMAALRTNKWQLHDAGRGLIILSICLLAIMAWFRLWSIHNARNIRTPRSTLHCLLIGSFAWLAYAPVEAFSLSEELDRGYFPHWADSIGIPMMYNALGVIFLLPFWILGGWIVFLRSARLPVNLWVWDAERHRRSMLWTIACGIVAAAFVFLIIATIMFGPPLYIPLLLIGFYLTLSARAAVISRPPRTGRSSQPLVT